MKAPKVSNGHLLYTNADYANCTILKKCHVTETTVSNPGSSPIKTRLRQNSFYTFLGVKPLSECHEHLVSFPKQCTINWSVGDTVLVPIDVKYLLTLYLDYLES